MTEQNPFKTPTHAPQNTDGGFVVQILGVILLAVLVSLYAILPTLLFLLVLLAGNAIAFVVFSFLRFNATLMFSFLACVFILATLLFSNWGFSMPNPRITICWACFIPACVFELALILHCIDRYSKNQRTTS